MSIQFRKILVTGGAGFVGANVAIALKERSADLAITCLDNLRRRGSELNVPRLRSAGITFIHGDIRCPEDLDTLDFDLLIECSAEPSVLAGYDNPAYMIRTNLDGAINCLELCRRSRAAFFFISTSRVYPLNHLLGIKLSEGLTRFIPLERQDFPGISTRGVSEEFPLDGTRSLYGASKYCVENLAAEYQAAFGVRCLINRCGILTGPWQMGKVDQGLIALWLMRHYFGEPLEYIGFEGSGKQVRDFLDIDDFCNLLWRELSNFDALQGQIFNVGGGPERSVSLRELTELARQATGNRIAIQPNPESRPGDIPYFVTDMSRLANQLHWRPEISPAQTMSKIVRWIREQESQVRQLL